MNVKITPKDVRNIKACYVNTLLNNWLEIDHKNVTSAIGKMEVAVLVCNDEPFLVGLFKEEAQALAKIMGTGNEKIAETDMAAGHALGDLFVREYQENAAIQKQLQSIYQG